MTTSVQVPIDRARGTIVVGLLTFATACWAYLVFAATQMGNMSSVLAAPMTSAWSSVEAGLMVVMWAVMMAAMMLPSAVPMVLTYDRMDGRSPAGRQGSTVLFIWGYAVVWTGFAVAATGLQWLLQHLALIDGMGEATQTGLASVLLVAAGVFQFSPVKRRSLGACRTPLGFLTTEWREGGVGALRMGLRHGTLCLQCCWAVMILLFVLGVMNLLWVAALAIFVLAEKVSRRGEAVSWVGGAVMIIWGVGVAVGG